LECYIWASSNTIQSTYTFILIKIAVLASDIAENGETIMIEYGSCCALLAQELATNRCVGPVTRKCIERFYC